MDVDEMTSRVPRISTSRPKCPNSSAVELIMYPCFYCFALISSFELQDRQAMLTQFVSSKRMRSKKASSHVGLHECSLRVGISWHDVQFAHHLHVVLRIPLRNRNLGLDCPRRCRGRQMPRTEKQNQPCKHALTRGGTSLFFTT